ncbi:hypothetical protein EVAR_28712_1 [Eumeta japonica]|uniref:Uncharacterized protein n=1 Tax=Eumeta variegata TaxID=151549 RepID=A0A4C1V5M3_EUMVA|nr:hypothetical protein EVAR_28712_1 [Eumeta japonica]
MSRATRKPRRGHHRILGDGAPSTRRRRTRNVRLQILASPSGPAYKTRKRQPYPAPARRRGRAARAAPAPCPVACPLKLRRVTSATRNRSIVTCAIRDPNKNESGEIVRSVGNTSIGMTVNPSLARIRASRALITRKAHSMFVIRVIPCGRTRGFDGRPAHPRAYTDCAQVPDMRTLAPRRPLF